MTVTRLRVLALEADHRLALVAHRLVRRIGWRGLALAGLATLDLFWAWSLWDENAAAPLQVAPAYQAVYWFGGHITPGRPLLTWAILFSLVGVACGIQVWMDDDRYGFAAAEGLKVLLVILVLAAWPVEGVQSLRSIGLWISLAMMIVAAQRGIPYRRD